jgi:uncharacterized RDD family membrane protein YckC
MIFGSKKGVPGPCPACDAPLDAAVVQQPSPSCPACGQPLVPVRVAGFWRRLVATTIDAVILLFTAGPLFYGLISLTGNPGPLRGGLGLDGLLQFLAVDPIDIVLWGAPLLGMAALYFILFIALSGRTPGQKLVGIRVINRAGGPPGPWRSMLRLAGTALGLAPGGLGSLWMAFDREKRAFHDYLTGTYVVREH